jgi:hypothetical protein
MGKVAGDNMQKPFLFRSYRPSFFLFIPLVLMITAAAFAQTTVLRVGGLIDPAASGELIGSG